VSEYTFVRNLQLLGEAESDYKFTNMDPAAAATAMQQKQKGYNAIVVWNPFVMETLNKRDDVHVLFDSSKIEGEIIDMVVMSAASLDQPGGDRFAAALADAFYSVSDRIEAADTREDTLVALGEKFSHLDAKAMEKVVEQTRFYKTPDAGVALFKSEDIKGVMGKVVAFEKDHEMLESEPKIAYGGDTEAHLRFETKYMEMAKAKR